jgi:DNA-binding beta-propeller fold protein YncE
VRAVVSGDNSSLWVTNFGADSVSVYDIDDGRMAASVRTGSRPDALAFSNDEHLLLVADTGSADTAVIRTQSKLTASPLCSPCCRRGAAQ